jgi:hypothetical protein
MPWKTFIAEHNNSLVNLLNKIAKDAANQNFDDLKTFLEYYKEKEVRKDVDRKWRDKAKSRRHGQVIDGKHEWIPTNLLSYMLAMAAGWEDVRWLIGMEVLRTPCSSLIYRGTLRKAPKLQEDGPTIYMNAHKLKEGAAVSEIVDLQGHVGSLYRDKESKVSACQVGMPGWHKHLREIIARRLNTGVDDLKGFTSELVQFIGTTIWSGSLDQLANFATERAGYLTANATKIACDYYSDRKGTRWGNCKTLAEMAMHQTNGYQQFTAILLNQFLALMSCPPPGRTSFDQTVEVLMQLDGDLPDDDDGLDGD